MPVGLTSRLTASTGSAWTVGPLPLHDAASMITSGPSFAPTEPNASALDAFRATPLGLSLEADPTCWQLVEAHPTTYATHLVLSHGGGHAELRVALSRDGSTVIEEDWHVRVGPIALDPTSLGERLHDLARAVESAVESVEELREAIGGQKEGSGPHERWTLALAAQLDGLQERATAVGGILRDASGLATDAVEAIGDGEKR